MGGARGVHDRLVDEGFVLFGGPLGDADGEHALLVVEATDEAEVRRQLEDDPWDESMLTIVRIERWLVWLRRPGL